MLTCHLHLAYQMYIFLLILFCDKNVGTIGLQISHFTHAKLLDLRTYEEVIIIPGSSYQNYLNTEITQ